MGTAPKQPRSWDSFRRLWASSFLRHQGRLPVAQHSCVGQVESDAHTSRLSACWPVPGSSHPAAAAFPALLRALRTCASDRKERKIGPFALCTFGWLPFNLVIARAAETPNG
jgi:hypothetical protein